MKQDTATKLRLTDLNHDETLVDIALLLLRLGAEGDYNVRKLYDRILTIDTARRYGRSVARVADIRIQHDDFAGHYETWTVTIRAKSLKPRGL